VSILLRVTARGIGVGDGGQLRLTAAGQAEHQYAVEEEPVLHA
jgi:hypothetical protein